MFLSGLTREQLARQRWLNERLHWLGLAIQQATASGMWAEVAQYTAEKERLQREAADLQSRARAEAQADVESAEAGPFGINTLLRDIPKYLLLAGAAYLGVLYFTRRGR